MSKPENLGVIKIVHPSGMRETDKGYKVYQGELGDTVMMESGKKAYIVKPELGASAPKKGAGNKKAEAEQPQQAAPTLELGGEQ